MENNNSPIHELRLGRIKAAIWVNTHDGHNRYSVKITKIYKEGNSWKSTTSFDRDDLLMVVKVADMAHSWIFGHLPKETEAAA